MPSDLPVLWHAVGCTVSGTVLDVQTRLFPPSGATDQMFEWNAAARGQKAVIAGTPPDAVAGGNPVLPLDAALCAEGETKPKYITFSAPEGAIETSLDALDTALLHLVNQRCEWPDLVRKARQFNSHFRVQAGFAFLPVAPDNCSRRDLHRSPLATIILAKFLGEITSAAL